MRQLTGMMAVVFFGLFVATPAWSSEADELREKAKAIQQKAEQLAKQGKGEKAEDLSRQAKELWRAAEKHDAQSPKDSDREIDVLHQKLRTLAEKEEDAERSKNKEALAEIRKYRAVVERELDERHEQRERKVAPKHEPKRSPELSDAAHDTARRIKHMHAAIENLHAAGLHDVAEELVKRAEAMEREMHHAHEPPVKQPPFKRGKLFDPDHKPPFLDRKHLEPERKFAPGHAPVEELRQELQRLRAELNELREEVKKRP